jgi:hypothetical protein
MMNQGSFGQFVPMTILRVACSQMIYMQLRTDTFDPAQLRFCFYFYAMAARLFTLRQGESADPSKPLPGLP